MTTTSLNGQFETRRQAEMTIERLVQEFGIDRADIIVGAAGEKNSAGVQPAGSDNEAGAPSTEARNDAALEGKVIVAVKLDDLSKIDDVRSAFAEFAADDVAQR